MKCQYCRSRSIKYGKQNDIQRYKCKNCNKTQLAEYKNKAWLPQSKELFIKSLGCGVGVRRMAYLIGISKPTILKWIKEGRRFKGIDIKKVLPNDEYEIDEMQTLVGKKGNKTWITYAISRTTRLPIALKVGRRTKESLKQVVDKVLSLYPKRIYTDGLDIYKTLIPKYLHKSGRRRINYIERKNLTLRERIKRICRKTISYTKKEEMLDYHLRWYFWATDYNNFKP
ncbi:MAG: IS1 family transposase [bacterium]